MLRPRGRRRRLDAAALAPLSLERLGGVTELAVRNLEDEQLGGLFADGGLEQLETLDLSYGYQGLERVGSPARPCAWTPAASWPWSSR